jgi:hypothetical protein
VNVADVAPSDIVLSSNVIDENQTFTLNGSFKDLGIHDYHDVTVEWGPNEMPTTFTLDPNTTNFSVPHQYLDDSNGSPFDVKVTVADRGGASASKTTSVTVVNVAPADLALNNGLITENDTFILVGSFADPGTLDEHVVTIDWDGGEDSQTVHLPAGQLTFRVPHLYLDSHSAYPGDLYQVQVMVTDDDGGAPATSGAGVHVVNDAPNEVTLVHDGTIDENGWLTVTGTFEDAGTLDRHLLSVTWGDGQQQLVPLDAGQRGFTIRHLYLDDDPTGTDGDPYTVQVLVIDSDGAAGGAGTTVNVRNVAPSNLAVSGVAAIDEGGTFVLDGTFDDPGTLDFHVVSVEWGGDEAEPRCRFARATGPSESRTGTPTITAARRIAFSPSASRWWTTTRASRPPARASPSTTWVRGTSCSAAAPSTRAANFPGPSPSTTPARSTLIR